MTSLPTYTILVDLGSPATWVAYRLATRLAGARPDLAVRWAPVSPPGRGVLGHPVDASTAAALLAPLGRWLPAGEPAPVVRVLSHPGAMTAAYAEALADGAGDRLLAVLMDRMWCEGRNLSDVAAVRSAVAAVLAPPVPAPARRLPDGPLVPLGDADPIASMRRLAGTVTPAGGPVSSAGQARITGWRKLWEARANAELPLVLTPLGEALPGSRGLEALARLVPQSRAATQPARPAEPATVPAPRVAPQVAPRVAPRRRRPRTPGRPLAKVLS